jgi:hypothetical protein
METPRNRLHPLLTAAAISLIVLSAAGIAALTGVLPNSRGSDPQAMAPEAQQPVPSPSRQSKHLLPSRSAWPVTFRYVRRLPRSRRPNRRRQLQWHRYPASAAWSNR